MLSPWVPDGPRVSIAAAGGFHLLLLLTQGHGLLLVCDRGLILHRGLWTSPSLQAGPSPIPGCGAAWGAAPGTALCHWQLPCPGISGALHGTRVNGTKDAALGFAKLQMRVGGVLGCSLRWVRRWVGGTVLPARRAGTGRAHAAQMAGLAQHRPCRGRHHTGPAGKHQPRLFSQQLG